MFTSVRSYTFKYKIRTTKRPTRRRDATLYENIVHYTAVVITVFFIYKRRLRGEPCNITTTIEVTSMKTVHKCERKNIRVCVHLWTKLEESITAHGRSFYDVKIWELMDRISTYFLLNVSSRPALFYTFSNHHN